MGRKGRTDRYFRTAYALLYFIVLYCIIYNYIINVIPALLRNTQCLGSKGQDIVCKKILIFLILNQIKYIRPICENFLLLKYWYIHEPMPMAEACGRSLVGIVGSNPTGVTNVCSFEGLCCQVEVCATG
jgi:hypothetical protein